MFTRYIWQTIIVIVFCNDASSTTVSPDDIAEETQHAICRVIAQDIQTSANATITRQLKGVCTTKQLENQFKQLELKLLLELNYIRNLLEPNGNSNVKKISQNTESSDYDYRSYEIPLDQKTNNQIVERSEEIDSRMNEILENNDTIRMLSGQKIYIYYWAIDRITDVLHKKGIHIRSPDFYVLGHELCVQLYPNHLNSDYLGIQLRPSGNFLKKHRITILDRFDSTKDINSQKLGSLANFEMPYRVPNEKVKERSYLFGDTMIIKIVIFLDS